MNNVQTNYETYEVRFDLFQLPERIGIYLCTDRCRTSLHELTVRSFEPGA